MRNHQAIILLLLILVAGISGAHAQNAGSGAANTNASNPLRFVRQFSSAQDVRRGLPPIVNRSLDIIAGAKEKEPVLEALQHPFGVTTDSSQRIWITDPGAGAVHIFDFVHSKYAVLQDPNHLRSPLGIAADRDGNIYVTDIGAGNVFVYDSAGKFMPSLKPSRGHESYFESPWGIAVDPVTERIYVCDAARHMVIALDRKGHVLAHFGPRGGGRGPAEFRYPTQVAVAGDEIAVLDSGNARVQILDAQGHFIREIGLTGTNKRAGLAIDNKKNVYVTDPELNRLVVFNHDGDRLYDFGEIGDQPGQFSGISGIWVDSRNCLYVVDSQNKRVQLFQIDRSDSAGCHQ
jgi:DNA-binding beta-propeller fold protein YncE